MTGRDDAAAIEARYQARLAEIEESYQAHLDAVPDFYADPRWGYRRPPMSESEAAEKRAAMIREAEEDRLRALQALELSQRLSHPPTERRSGPRSRPPDQLPATTVRRCEDELRKRAQAGRPRYGSLTLMAIATRLGWPRARVTQAEALMEVGWPLLRTHPDFSADQGHVRWPTPRQAARLLRSR